MQQKIRFQIEGMTCQACASRIEKVLNKKDFVESAGVNFASEEAQVTFDDSKTSIADIIAPGRTRSAYRLAAVAALCHQHPLPYRHGGDARRAE